MTRPRFVSAQQLLDMVAEPLDPGYAEAAARRGPNPPRRWYDTPVVVLGAFLVGFVLVVAYIHTHRGAPEAAKVHDRLVARVRGAEHTVTGLTKQVTQLESQIAVAGRGALPTSLLDTLGAEELAAGTKPVHGPGLTVHLDEPAGTTSTHAARPGSTPMTATNILTDRDVRSVVNELWVDGAEAIAVNGVRLTPVSAIRFAGEAVLVDFVPISPPYAIRAIGNADELATNFASSAVASRYQTLVGAEHIRFSFAESTSLKLPAAAPLEIRYARSGR
jgi:uncharacterized protein YlxW (UPF0749 family)